GTIRISGNPCVDVVINGGVAGDTATVASLVNSIPRVIKAQPGLCTMMDIALPRIFTGKSNF
ncbi:NADP-binding protein, partial [candidate division KSB1 bacterium]|nr:NADP-binding protein [candidate division KSB1 bacterium]